MNQADGKALLAALDRGESLPANWYLEPSIAARETERIFRKSWHYVGPAKALAQLGDYIAGFAGEVAVVAVRNEDGIAAFVNVCRHRRHEVMRGRGNARSMQCPYHAWTYDLAGCLKRAPRSQSERDFRLEDYPLLPIRAETFGPFVFVNLDQNAAPISERFGQVLEIIRQCGIDIDTLEPHRRDKWESDANWKAMLENYLECYHCAVAHPGFSAAIDVRPENYKLTQHGWFLSQIGNVRPGTIEGKSSERLYDTRGGIAQSQYHFLWPNFTININPGFPNLSVDVWIPDGPSHTRGFSEHYFGPGVTEEFARELVAFNRQVGLEDHELTSSVQRGLRGGIPERGRFFVESEHLVIAFQKMVVRALVDESVT
jgi:phenylpropionate dioxygenase-like ring-hydroxylating dioxygenase large terminal subunit